MTGFRPVIQSGDDGRMTDRTRLAGETVVVPHAESSKACISDIKKQQNGLVNSCPCQIAGQKKPLAIRDAPDSRAMVTVCTTVRTTGHTSFEISTWLASGYPGIDARGMMLSAGINCKDCKLRCATATRLCRQ